jgi:hypothetical protein
MTRFLLALCLSIAALNAQVLPQFSGFRSATMDPLVAAFRVASGATDTTGIAAIVRYARAQGLINNIQLYTFKSAQNAGTGSTLYGVGGLGLGHMTLVGSPSWASANMSMNTTTQYGTISGLTGNGTLTVFVRRSGVPAASSYIVSQYEFTESRRSWGLVEASGTADAIWLNRSSNGAGTNPNIENYASAASAWGSAEATYVAQWIAGAGRACWTNKTSVTLTILVGQTPQTQRFAASDPIGINAIANSGGPSAFAGGNYVSLLIIANVTPSDTQREALTDLVNAL